MSKNFLSLLPGSLVQFEQEVWEIRTVYDTSFIAARNKRSGEVRRLRVSELAPVSEDQPQNDSGISASAATTDDSLWQEALQKYNLIRPLIELGLKRTAQDVETVAQNAGVKMNTLYRWIRTFSATGQISSLVKQSRKDVGSSRLAPEVDALITATIKELYLSDQRRKPSSICTAIRERCIKAGLKPPHANTLRNRMFLVASDLKLSKRFNRKIANEKVAPLKGAFPGAGFPLSVVQIDHTKMDVIVVDEYDRRPLGRPWLTLAFDLFSRMVCGFYISFATPGTLGTALCLSHAILPKEQWLAKLNITNDWPVWGCPQCIHLDNAKEFRGNALKRACEEYGIRIEWRPVATPHWGGHIERMMGTLGTALHELPGTTFSNTQERGHYDSAGKATLTLYELEQWLAEYITGVYHKRLHSEIGMPPEKMWEIGILGDDNHPGTGLLPLPINPNRLLLDFLPIEYRSIQRYGVAIERIHYYSDVLRQYIASPAALGSPEKQKYAFRYDPRDMSKIFFLDPTLNEYFEIPYRNMSHPSLNLWEIREARKYALQQGIQSIDEQAIFDSYERLRRIESQAKQSTRKTRRMIAKNTDKHRRPDTFPSATPKAPMHTLLEDSIEDDEVFEAFDDIKVEVN
jgi:putative transposase